MRHIEWISSLVMAGKRYSLTLCQYPKGIVMQKLRHELRIHLTCTKISLILQHGLLLPNVIN